MSWAGWASSELIVSAPSLANAALVGAKTVNGPGPESAGTSPAVETAVTSWLQRSDVSAVEPQGKAEKQKERQ
eukprot:SAG22_NODE_125_length_18883_cov_12.351629_4_plen_73_part_00